MYRLCHRSGDMRGYCETSFAYMTQSAFPIYDNDSNIIHNNIVVIINDIATARAAKHRIYSNSHQYKYETFFGNVNIIMKLNSFPYLSRL
ncbi:hypothetical protein QTP88_005153 [Uroleucon formosanum]